MKHIGKIINEMDILKRKPVYIRADHHAKLKSVSQEIDMTIQDFLEIILDTALYGGEDENSESE